MKYQIPTNVRLEPEVHKRLAAYAASQGTSVSGVIRKLIERVIKPVTTKNKAND